MKALKLLFLLCGFVISSCSDSNEDPCDFTRTINFNVTCSNCTDTDRLNVQIFGSGANFSGGSAVISSDSNFEIPVTVSSQTATYNVVTNRVGTSGTTLTQASGSVSFGSSCAKSVDVQVSF